MIYAYLRVSTAEQADDGYGLGAQREAIQRWADYRSFSDLAWTEDAGVSAQSLDRPGITSLLQGISRGDVLVVASLDRLSRSLVDFLGLIERSAAEGWALAVLDFDLDTSTANGRLVANLLMSIVQWEREMGAERTRAALAEARRNGKQLGRPSRLPSSVADRIHSLAGEHSQTAIADMLNADGIPTPAGFEHWSRQQISRVLRA